MTLKAKIKQAIEENPDLPAYYVTEVIEACDASLNSEDLQKRLREINWRSFFIDNGEEPPSDLAERLKKKSGL